MTSPLDRPWILEVTPAITCQKLEYEDVRYSHKSLLNMPSTYLQVLSKLAGVKAQNQVIFLWDVLIQD